MTVSFGAAATFRVPVARTFSNILLVAGVIAATSCSCAGTGGAGASFFATALALTGAFLSFFGAKESFPFAAALFVAFMLVSVVTSFPTIGTASVTTFLGRPRFLAGGGSSLGAVDIVEGQLMRGGQKKSIQDVQQQLCNRDAVYEGLKRRWGAWTVGGNFGRVVQAGCRGQSPRGWQVGVYRQVRRYYSETLPLPSLHREMIS